MKALQLATQLYWKPNEAKIFPRGYAITVAMSLLSGAKGDIGVLDHHIHSRWRVYPQNVGSSIALTAGTPANTFGSWTLAVPVDTVPFCFAVIGISIEAVSVATVYHIQVGYNPVNAEPGVNMEMGERRFNIESVPISRATEILAIHSQDMPANGSVWAKLKTASGNADTANISLVLGRHLEVSRELPLWATFPW